VIHAAARIEPRRSVSSALRGVVRPAAAPKHGGGRPAQLLELQRSIGNARTRDALAGGLDSRLVRSRRSPLVAPSRLARIQRHCGCHEEREREQPIRLSRDGRVLRRYEAFEHALFGAIEQYIAPLERTHVVQRGEMPQAIATRYGVPVDALLRRNASRLHRWRTRQGHHVEGFSAGETIVVPTEQFVVQDPAPGAVVPPQRTVTISGVSMTYGEAIAMGDLYATPQDLLSANAAELRRLLALIQAEGRRPGSVSAGDWDAATGGRYTELARRNVSHFAPSDPGLVPVSPRTGTVNHKTEWERWHRLALDEAQRGNRDRALAINAFAAHFLTDAFAAGHLINKEDLVAGFQGRLLGNLESFTTRVAAAVFANATAQAFISRFETVELYGVWPVRFHADIDSASRFATLLRQIHHERPDVLENAVVKAVHDRLNTEGVDVENARHEGWRVRGDGSLEERGREIGRRAVAQSVVNVLNAAPPPRTLDYGALFATVWEHTPRPTAAAQRGVRAAVADLADPATATTVARVSAIVISNLDVIFRKLVELCYLKPISETDAALGRRCSGAGVPTGGSASGH
jgi:hypothetical protein